MYTLIDSNKPRNNQTGFLPHKLRTLQIVIKSWRETIASTLISRVYFPFGTEYQEIHK